MEASVDDHYRHTPLADPLRDIRLVRLLPGQFRDDLRIELTHASLVEATKPEDNRLPLARLRELLPEPWLVRTTVEGRYIFENPQHQGRGSWQWEFPAKNVSPSSYLHPGDEADGFQPRYDALSYTWGEAGTGGEIMVQAQQSAGDEPPKSKKLAVPENLTVALRYLRSSESPRTLWIDALCINQKDEAEKPSQVRRMGAIYRSAHRVIAWLGPEANSSSQAMQTLTRIGDQLEYLEGGHVCPSPDAVEYGWHDPAMELPFDSDTWDAVYSLFCREWYDRVWVVQEILLADTRALLQCGADTIPFTVFRRAATCIKENHHATKLELRLRHLAKMTNPWMGLPFDRVLRMGYERKCKDPRDYVYGVLGLAPKKLAAKFRPNYMHSVSQVYTEMTLLYSDHVQRLDILQGACQYGRRLNTPSWVPDLTAKLAKLFPCNGQFSAGFSRAHFTFEAPGTMVAQGVQCATVVSVSSSLPAKGEKAYATIREWEPEGMMTAPYPHNDTLERAHLMALRKGRVGDRWVGWNNIYPAFKDWELAWQRIVGSDTANGADKTAPTAPAIKRYIYDAINFSVGHAYVQTAEGYVGLAPLDAQTGDTICVLLGCDFPVLLREQEPGRFIVVGECFVHGLQDAISILGPLPAPWEVQMFKSFGNRYKYRFYNRDTKELIEEDPRLAGIDLEGWERFEHEPEPDDPPVFDYFRHKTTGDVMNSDPRMLPEALEARGIKLEWLTLI